MVGGCTYRDRLALVVHDRPGDRGLLRNLRTTEGAQAHETHVTKRPAGAYESDDESDDAVDDQKGRRRQPESDEARAVHIHQKKDLSY